MFELEILHDEYVSVLFRPHVQSVERVFFHHSFSPVETKKIYIFVYFINFWQYPVYFLLIKDLFI